MKSKRRSKRPDQGSMQVAVVKTLKKLEQVANDLRDGMGEQEKEMDGLFEKLFVLEEALEMNFWVQIKMAQEGCFEPDSEERRETVSMVSKAQELQREYLGVLGITLFFKHLGSSGASEPEGQ